MKVLVSQDHGFRVQEISRPLLNEGEMLLQVTACGVCFSDVHKIRFQRMEDPVVLGHEVAGRVVESSAAKFKVGDRVVVAHHVPVWPMSLLLPWKYFDVRGVQKTISIRVDSRSLCVCR